MTERRALHALADVAQSLVVCADLPELLDAVSRALPRLGIPNAFIALDAPAPAHAGELRLVLSTSRAVTPEADPEVGPLLLERALAAHDDACVYVLESLFFAERALGVAGFELGPRDGAVYEGLRAHVSAGLESVTLMAAQRVNAVVRERLLERAATHGATLERLLEHLIVAEEAAGRAALPAGETDATAESARAPLRSALEALAVLTHAWSRFVGKERETLRAPPDTASTAAQDDG